MRFSFVLTFLFLIASAVLFGQSGETQALPESLDISQYFYSLPALTGLVLIVTELFKKFLDTDGNYSIYLSWIIAFGVSLGGWAFQLGMFKDLEWYYIFIYGLSAGLMANGLFDLDIIKKLLQALKLKYRTIVVLLGALLLTTGCSSLLLNEDAGSYGTENLEKVTQTYFQNCVDLPEVINGDKEIYEWALATIPNLISTNYDIILLEVKDLQDEEILYLKNIGNEYDLGGHAAILQDAWKEVLFKLQLAFKYKVNESPPDSVTKDILKGY